MPSRKTTSEEGNYQRGCELGKNVKGLGNRDAIEELAPFSPVGRKHNLRQVHIICDMVEPNKVELVGREEESYERKKQSEEAGQPFPWRQGKEQC